MKSSSWLTGGNALFDSGTFAFNEASKRVILNHFE